MTANDSSSSAAKPADALDRSVVAPLSEPEIDLATAGLLSALPAAFTRGEALELLRPLRFLAPGETPSRPAGEPVDRRALAQALAGANAGYGHPEAASLAERLADPATEVVVTGQQTGLFGGPQYALSKAVAAVLWAERLEAAGRTAVPVFWMATEDHDFREVARASFPGPAGLTEIDLGEDPSPLMPVGMRTLGPNVGAALEDLRAAVPGERFSAWVERLATWYRPDARFGEAFARLMAGLLGARCPLLLDAMLPAVKEAERPWLRKIVTGHADLAAAYVERDRETGAAGFELQVTPQPGATPLFYLHGGERRRLMLEDGRLSLRGVEAFSEDREWLLRVVEENPAVVSPGVLARPAVQDAILGTTLQVLGPGEVSYMPQVAPIYEQLGLAAPWIAVRPQALVLGAHQLDKVASTGLGLAQLVAPDLDLNRALGGDLGEELVAAAAADILVRLEQLREAALAIDGTLEGPIAKTRDRIEGALSAFAAKTAQAVSRLDQVKRQRAEALREACRPAGAFQERVVSSAHFPGKYGDSVIEALFGQMDLDWRRLSIIRPA